MENRFQGSVEPLEEGELMSLWENFFESCIMLDKQTESDGFGGFETVYKDGAPFRAAIVKEKTLAAKVAEKQGVTEIYTVTTDKGTHLSAFDVFCRVADGTTFRVRSNAKDSETPEMASFSFEQVSAERWELPA